MSEENLNRAQIAGGLVDNRCLRAPKGMRAVLLSSQSDAYDPLVYEPCILSSAEVIGVVDPTRENIVCQHTASPFQPCEQARPCIAHQLKLDRLAGLGLNDDCSSADLTTEHDIADFDLHHV